MNKENLNTWQQIESYADLSVVLPIQKSRISTHPDDEHST